MNADNIVPRAARICAVARAVAVAAIHGRSAPPRAEDLADIVSEGVFVTLRIGRTLRGCIGLLTTAEPFPMMLAEAARRSATEDLRFPRITEQELEDLRVEVTLLGARERIEDAEDFILGEHGLVLECEGRRGLLLPQVPLEQRWDKREFLRGLCRKAGVPDAAWNAPGARLYRFRGTVLREDSDIVVDDAQGAGSS